MIRDPTRPCFPGTVRDPDGMLIVHVHTFSVQFYYAGLIMTPIEGLKHVA
jgi:hypothetical protein